jgi:hypothetical protein
MYHHKYQIIEELFNRGLLDETRFSWVDNKSSKNLSNKKLVDYLQIDVNDFRSIQLEGDVMYGSDLSNHEEYLYTINPDWYYRSKVNIITETNLNESEIHMTEKTWKAIYLGVPFVISASKHHLKTLRDMGFKTFNSVINEDYDEMIQLCAKRLEPNGKLFFSTNSRRFNLDTNELSSRIKSKEITNKTIPEDFKHQKPHRCWEVTVS